MGPGSQTRRPGSRLWLRPSVRPSQSRRAPLTLPSRPRPPVFWRRPSWRLRLLPGDISDQRWRSLGAPRGLVGPGPPPCPSRQAGPSVPGTLLASLTRKLSHRGAERTLTPDSSRRGRTRVLRCRRHIRLSRFWKLDTQDLTSSHIHGELASRLEDSRLRSASDVSSVSEKATDAVPAPSGPAPLPEALRPNPIPLGVRAPMYELWGTRGLQRPRSLPGAAPRPRWYLQRLAHSAHWFVGPVSVSATRGRT